MKIVDWWKKHNLAAPHVVLWRMVWIIPYLILSALVILCAYLMWGKSRALMAIDDLFR